MGGIYRARKLTYIFWFDSYFFSGWLLVKAYGIGIKLVPFVVMRPRSIVKTNINPIIFLRDMARAWINYAPRISRRTYNKTHPPISTTKDYGRINNPYSSAGGCQLLPPIEVPWTNKHSLIEHPFACIVYTKWLSKGLLPAMNNFRIYNTCKRLCW